MRNRAMASPEVVGPDMAGPRRSRWAWILAIVVAGVVLGACQPTPGPALFLVTTTADGVDATPGDGVCRTTEGRCSLRAAVMEANRTDSDDYIRLPAGNYVLSLPGDENEAVGGDLDSLHGLVIERSGSGVVTVDQAVAGQRVFEGTWMKVSDIAITGGDSDGSGGGVLADQLTLERVTVTANHADGSGGGVEATTSLSVTDSVITGNSASGSGGGARAAGSLLLERTTIGSNDSGDAGGGISAASVSSTATITDTTIEDNDATNQGGGAALAGPATVLRSRLRANRATGPGAGLSSSGSVQVTASTIDANISTGATGTGGGISVAGGTTSMVNSTVSANTASVGGGGVHVAGGSAAIAFSTINANSAPIGEAVAQSVGAATLTASALGGTCSGTIASGGSNVGSAPSGCGLVAAGDLQGATLDLGPLGLAGGTTPVHVPLPGSVLIDRIDNATAGCATTVAVDQRGQVRPTNFAGTPRCDSGAVETAPVTAVVNDVGDSVDANPGDGICADAAAKCTLRAALGETNAWPGGDNIRFASPGMAVELSLTGAGAGNDTTNLSIEESVDIDGDGATVDANQIDNVVMNLTGTSTIREITFTGGQASGATSGGAIDNQATLTLIDVTVDGNTVVGSGNGGGIANPGTLTLTTSRVTGNSLASDAAVRGGGGIVSSGSLTITGSTIDGNSAPGATHKGGGLWLTSAATITASTVSNNSTGGNGGGLEVGDAVVLTNSTLSTNQAGGGGAVSFVGTANPATTILRHTTVTANTATVTANSDLLLHAGGAGRINATSSIIDGQCGGGTLVSGGHNVSSTVSGVGGCNLTQVTDIAGANVRVGPLQDNGGPTRTHKPLGGSRAIDKVSACCAQPPCPTVPTDQRGVARPVRALSTPATTNCDAGAVEYDTLITPLSLTVDDGGDSRDQTPGDGICSDGTPAPSCTLRAAIDEVNVWPADDMLQTFASMYAADTITVDPSVDDIQLSLSGAPGTAEDANADGDLDLRVRANVVGSGVVIHGTGTDRVLHVQCSFACPVGIADLTITGGNTVGLVPANMVGGGIRVDTTALTLDRVTVRDNVSGFHGGGIYNQAGAPLTITNSAISGNSSTASTGQGGGIYNSAGGLVVRNTTISGNSTPSPGTGFGANNAGATLEHVTLTGNTGGGSSSIAVGTGAVNLRNTIVDGTCGGGNLVSQGYNVLSTASGCGMSAGNNDVLSGTVDFGPLGSNGGPTETHLGLFGSSALGLIPTGTNGCGTTFTTDQRGLPRGAEPCDAGATEVGTMVSGPVSLVVDDPGDTLDVSPGDGVCADASSRCTLRAAIHETNNVPAADTVTLAAGTNPVLSMGGDTNMRGDLDVLGDVVIDGAGQTISGSIASRDRVFEIGTARTVTIRRATVSGGIRPLGSGGGIRNLGTLSLDQVTVSGNATTGAGGHGGGIEHAAGALTIARSTISGNTSSGAGSVGGGILANTSFNLQSSTVSGNTSFASGGGMIVTNGIADVRHSTIAANTAPAGTAVARSVNGSVRFTSSIVAGTCLLSGTGFTFTNGHNIGSAPSGCGLTGPGDQQNTDPQLGPLASVGGPTATHVPASTSPVIDDIDAGTNGCANAPYDFDQRGLARALDGDDDLVERCDVGAVEISSPNVTVTSTIDAPDAAIGDGRCQTTVVGECTLRAAVQERNVQGGGDITLSSGSTYLLTLTGAGEDASGTGDLDVAMPLVVHADGPGLAEIDVDHLDNGFDVIGATSLTLDHLRLRDAGTGGSDEAAVRALDQASVLGIDQTHVVGTSGDGVLANGTTSITAGTVSGSTSAAVRNNLSGGAFPAVTIADSTMSGNAGTAVGVTGASSLAINGTTITSNGQGLASGTTTTVANSIVAGNTNDCAAAMPAAFAGAFSVAGPSCGAVGLPAGPVDLLALADNGGPTPTHLTLATSAAIDGSGPCAGTDQRGAPRGVDFEPGAETCDAGAVERPAPSQLTITPTVTTDAVDALVGDGVCETAVPGECTLRAAIQETNVWPTDDTITLTSGSSYTTTIAGTGEDAGATGDLDVAAVGRLTITASGATLAGIDGSSLDRVLHLRSGELVVQRVELHDGLLASAGQRGAGILAEPGSTLTVRDSHVRANSIPAGGDGGGLASLGADVTVDGTTVSSNAVGSGSGGGIHAEGGTLAVRRSTLSDNIGSGGSGIVVAGATATVNDTTIASTQGTAHLATLSGGTITVTNSLSRAGGGGIECSGTGIISNGGNVVTMTSCGFTQPTDHQGVAVVLGALGDNGGPVPTRLPGLGVLDQGAGCGTTDQTGAARPTDGDGDGTTTCDAGAVERPTGAPLVFTADTTTDAVDAIVGDRECATSTGQCSLRAAVQETNVWSTADRIRLTSGSAYGFALTGADDAAAVGDLDVIGDLTVEATAAGHATIDANDLDRGFDVTGAGRALHLARIDLVDGQATGNGGAVRATAGATLEMDEVRVQSSTASMGGGVSVGGVGTSADIANSTLTANAATRGGALYASAGASVTLDGLDISNNTATSQGGGGIAAEAGNAIVTVTGTTVTANRTTGDAGGGLGAFPGSTVNVAGSTISGNDALTGGDGAFVAAGATMTVDGSTVADNTGEGLGANGDLMVTRTTARDNDRIGVIGHIGSTVGLTASTVSGNGLYGAVVSGTGTIERSTISSNWGHGIGAPGTLSIVDSTITRNAGYGVDRLDGTVTVRNSIIAAQMGYYDDCSFFLTTLGFNVETSGTCGLFLTTDWHFDPWLLPLADNGGPTRTHRPLGGGGLVDTGSGCAATDQTGAARPTDGDADGTPECDRGAVELSVSPLTFVVNSTNDADDAVEGDGLCETATAGECTLRAAVSEANWWPTDDVVELASGTTYPRTLADVSGDEDGNTTGDLDVWDNLEIRASGAALASLDAAGLGRGLDVHARGTAPNIILTAVTLTRVEVTGGDAGPSSGGGVRAGDTTQLTLAQSRITANTGNDGGGVHGSGALVQVGSSTIDANTGTGWGGGIGVTSSSTLVMEDSTVSGNSAPLGGGISVSGVSTALILNSTITDNTGGGIGVLGSIDIESSIVANQQTGANCSNPVSSSDGHNVESTDTCGFDQPGDQVGADPDLGTLADNGGPTPTHLPDAGSPVIDNDAFCSTADQRGTARPQGASCDSGAVEQ